jgi:hypothetical protein
VNKATIEALVKSGAFDDVHSRDDRASLVATIESAVSAGQKLAADRAAGQGALFGAPADDEPQSNADAPLVRVEPWSESETLKQEKETLGFYVSSHPLEQWKDWSAGVREGARGRTGRCAAGPAGDRGGADPERSTDRGAQRPERRAEDGHRDDRGPVWLGGCGDVRGLLREVHAPV